MIISNCCILPEGWTVDTFMEPHNSRPYNPDIANVFYRAGYIEHWGRGIQKICDACKELGAEPPVYELLGNGLRVHFKALESAIIDESKTPNRHNGGLSGGIDDRLAARIISVIRNPKSSDKDFEWGEDFKGFTITITDPENRYHLKESKFVSFTLSNPKYKFLTVRDYLGLSAE